MEHGVDGPLRPAARTLQPGESQKRTSRKMRFGRIKDSIDRHKSGKDHCPGYPPKQPAAHSIDNTTWNGIAIRPHTIVTASHIAVFSEALRAPS